MDDVQARIDAIRRNRTSGAAELAIEAAEALRVLAESPGFSPEALAAAARALVRAQPAMAPIFNVANIALSSTDVAAACRAFISRVRNATRAVAANAAGLVRDGMTVMTHSYSSTVLEALRAAKANGARFAVVCTESRPMREGVALAEKLGREGIPTRVIADAAMYSLVGEVRLALAGADSLSPKGLMNKTGTALLALAARTLGVPVYALCGSEKFLPADWELPQEHRDPREILERPVENVTALNYYFEWTPLEFLTGVVTEEGIFAPGELLPRLAALKVHEALRGQA